MVLHKSNPYFLWLTSGSPSAAKAQHWRPLAQKKNNPELLHLSRVIPGTLMWLQWPLCGSSMDDRVESWINYNVTRQGKKCCTCVGPLNINFLCSNVTVLIINAADARRSIVAFINNLALKTKPRKQRMHEADPWAGCDISTARFGSWNRNTVDNMEADLQGDRKKKIWISGHALKKQKKLCL